MSEQKNKPNTGITNKKVFPDPKEFDTKKKGFASEQFNKLKPKAEPKPHLRAPAPEVMEVGKKEPKKPEKTEVSKSEKAGNQKPDLPNVITEDLNILQKTERETKLNIFRLADFLHKNSLIPSSIKTVEEAVVSIQTAMSLGFRTHGEVSLALSNIYVPNLSLIHI